ncbi:hypothetical protein [Flavobacterium dankookense]|uniref:Uncharacterized protein n=1 Tax=Flavobacterium dankookense TaxID=706186 RepID=A0A4R6Q7H8_9FLAO|nr:hypothetical protein [Flavobacterium dankookense]TDP58181.1 hypothetical protein BC748_2210 [Flavobacterium dankookense]
MKKIILFLFLINVSFSISQVKEIIIKSSINNEGLHNVLLYSENKLIGATNTYGKVKIDITNLNSIQLVKEDYYDLSLSKGDISDVIFLDFIQTIELNEVRIQNLSNKQILEKIEYNLTKNQQIYSNSLKTQYYNLLLVEKDTLHYLNNRLIWKMNDGRYINLQNKIIKNFKEAKNTLTYNVRDKNVSFWIPINSRMRSIYFQKDFPEILKNKEDYYFNIINDSVFHKIIFKSKKKRKFSYEGYIIVDKDDFGIYELQMNLTKNKSNTVDCLIVDDKAQQSYFIENETLFYSFKKNDLKYELVTSKYDLIFTQTKGNFKGNKFTNKFRIESTSDFCDNNAIKFDLNNYEKL